MPRRTGRRPGKQDTRETILAAARDVFAERGYDRASMRQIAAAAEVDPALIHHYFGSKDQLFTAVVRPPIDPETLLPEIFAGDIDQVPERLVHTFLSKWESPVSGAAFRSLFRGAITHKLTGRLLKEFFATQIVRRVILETGGQLDPNEVPLRASYVASQLIGVAVTRYLLELEPIASEPLDNVVAAVAPSIQRYLAADLSKPE